MAVFGNNLFSFVFGYIVNHNKKERKNIFSTGQDPHNTWSDRKKKFIKLVSQTKKKKIQKQSKDFSAFFF